MGSRALVTILLVILAACSPPPTPLPITPIASKEPTPEAVGTGGAVSSNVLPTRVPVRYGILPNTADYAPIEAFQQANAQVDILTELSVLEDYDVLTGFGVYDGWTESPVVVRVSMILNPQLEPLNNTEIAAQVVQAVNAANVIAGMDIPGMTALHESDASSVRQTLANLGYPDGFTIYGTVEPLPGVESVLAELDTSNIELRVVENTALQPHIQVVGWHDESEHAALSETHGEENVIDLYTLPISYYTTSDLLTTFTDDGWVIAARRGES